ncbi:MAG TPA: hypothetical protein VFF82_04905 [Rhodocyclaceae bacterium]|nr:hypothetical protein [Rhodocyclaceae bacterium]
MLYDSTLINNNHPLHMVHAETIALPVTRLYANIAYALLVFGWLFPPILLLGLVINLWRKGRANGTWLESHFRLQIRWFLIPVFVASLLGLLALFGPGVGYLMGSMIGSGQMNPDTGNIFMFAPLAILVLAVIVFEIRMLAGWIALNRNQSIS